MCCRPSDPKPPVAHPDRGSRSELVPSSVLPEPGRASNERGLGTSPLLEVLSVLLRGRQQTAQDLVVLRPGHDYLPQPGLQLLVRGTGDGAPAHHSHKIHLLNAGANYLELGKVPPEPVHDPGSLIVRIAAAAVLDAELHLPIGVPSVHVLVRAGCRSRR